MRPFDAIIFDLGSTLLYFDGNWPEVLSHANEVLYRHLVAAGLELDRAKFLQAYRQQLDSYYQERDSEFIEYTTHYLLSHLLEEWGYPNVSDDILRPALEATYAVSQEYWRLEDDALPTLHTLRQQGYRLGLISNAADDADVQALVDKAGLRPYFDKILTSAAEGIRKPNPRLFQKMLDFWSLSARRVAMVGDMLGADILGAKSAGIFAIWITRRADNAANRAHFETIHPDAVIHRLDELPGLLKKIELNQVGHQKSERKNVGGD